MDRRRAVVPLEDVRAADVDVAAEHDDALGGMLPLVRAQFFEKPIAVAGVAFRRPAVGEILPRGANARHDAGEPLGQMHGRYAEHEEDNRLLDVAGEERVEVGLLIGRVEAAVVAGPPLRAEIHHERRGATILDLVLE